MANIFFPDCPKSFKNKQKLLNLVCLNSTYIINTKVVRNKLLGNCVAHETCGIYTQICDRVSSCHLQDIEQIPHRAFRQIEPQLTAMCRDMLERYSLNNLNGLGSISPWREHFFTANQSVSNPTATLLSRFHFCASRNAKHLAKECFMLKKHQIMFSF